MPKVIIGQGISVELRPQDVLGSGGEGTVFKAVLPSGVVALKVYHDPTLARGQKLSAFQIFSHKLPPEVISLIDLARDAYGKKIVGFTMRLLPPGQQAFETLSNRKIREAGGTGTKEAVDLFLKLHPALECLHDSGVVAGDLNSLNLLYKLYKMPEIALIDADSFQFGGFPCVVATEKYLTPRLYGVDLSLKPVFEPLDDWYSYLVLFFSGLLLVHPYGGAHRVLRTIPKRAQNRVFILDPSVTYPVSAYRPEVISDDLLEFFSLVFAQGKLAKPEINLLQNYRQDLVECPICGLGYPHIRKNCPGCLTLNQLAQIRKEVVSGIRVTELFQTSGTIVFFKLVGKAFYCIANEGGQTVLYVKEQLCKPRRIVLFKAIHGAKYEVFDRYLVVCPDPYADEPQLYILDISSDKPQPVTNTVSDRFGDKKSIFGGTENSFYRVIDGMILRGQIPFGKDLVENVCATGMERQVWFEASPSLDQELFVGMYRVFEKYEWFLVRDGKQLMVKIPQLEKGESLIDQSVKFSVSKILLLRRTRKAGEDFCRIEVLDTGSGEVVSSRKVSLTDNPHYGDIQTVAFFRGTILFSTDEGLLAENSGSGNQKLFSATKNYVTQGDTIWPYQDGVLIVSSSTVTKLAM